MDAKAQNIVECQRFDDARGDWFFRCAIWHFRDTQKFKNHFFFLHINCIIFTTSFLSFTLFFIFIFWQSNKNLQSSEEIIKKIISSWWKFTDFAVSLIVNTPTTQTELKLKPLRLAKPAWECFSVAREREKSYYRPKAWSFTNNVRFEVRLLFTPCIDVFSQRFEHNMKLKLFLSSISSALSRFFFLSLREHRVWN